MSDDDVEFWRETLRKQERYDRYAVMPGDDTIVWHGRVGEIKRRDGSGPSWRPTLQWDADLILTVAQKEALLDLMAGKATYNFDLKWEE